MKTRMIDRGLGPYVHDVASTRYPIYTRGNAGEVYPEVFYPLSHSIAMAGSGIEATRRAMLDSGVITTDDLAGHDVPPFSGVFSGYAYLNLSIARMAISRIPGGTVDDVDSAGLGGVDDIPPYERQKGDRNLLSSLRSLRYTWQTLKVTELPQLEAQKRQVDQWVAGLPDVATATDAELLAVTANYHQLFSDLWETHLVISNKSGVGIIGLSRICRDELDDESLALTMLGGLGDVESAAPTWRLWHLGRLVADSTSLSAHFDAGIAGLQQRLSEDPTAEAFNDAFADFLEEFGSRGPNEWEIACEVWGTNPDLALTLVDRMRGAAIDHAPDAQQAELRQRAQHAIGRARSELNRPNRWVFERALTSAQVFSAGRERSKTTIIRALHAARLIYRELGARAAAKSGGSPDDIWFLLVDEVEGFLEDPGSFTDQIAARRATRDALSELEPPFFFVGEQPPPTEWKRRSTLAAEAENVEVGEVMAGIAGCTGVARGRARVVLDPSDPGDLGPGDVLVAPHTDPSWTPLFLPAEAVIVDVGAQMSHAVIVSRELGIPCVVSVTDATRRIPDGALVEVDGSSGQVTVIEMP